MREIEKVKKYIHLNNMVGDTDCIIAGVSGGADSICLLCMLLDIYRDHDVTIVAVHIHHGIRGAEADRDQAFVENICNQEKIQLYKYKYNIPEYAKSLGLSEEEAGRIKRYETFRMVKNELESGGKKCVIAVAHNQNDNVETFIHNLCRGSSINGLSGIKPVSGDIIRPVLCLSRNEIETYLRENKREYIIDSTNLELDYTRNKIRNIVIPCLNESINNKSSLHISQTMADIGEINEYLDRQVEIKSADIVSEKNGQIFINRKELNSTEIVLAREIIRNAIGKAAGRLKDITRKHIEDVMELSKGQTGKYVMLPYDLIAKNQYENLIIKKREDDSVNEEEVIINGIGEYEFRAYKVRVEITEISQDERLQCTKNDKNICTKCFDYDKIKNTVCIRNRKSGDFLTINKQMGTKKLKSYLVDEKIPSELRNVIPVIADGNHILWVYGHRISEYYKIDENTIRVMKITITQ